MARRDDLTGLLTDREFFSAAQRKLPTLMGQWCVAAIDIENFKLFCDWHGQQAGRFLLAEIGSTLQNVEQKTGGLAGYRGQDDFALLVPYDVHGINDLFERIRALVNTEVTRRDLLLRKAGDLVVESGVATDKPAEPEKSEEAPAEAAEEPREE